MDNDRIEKLEGAVEFADVIIEGYVINNVDIPGFVYSMIINLMKGYNEALKNKIKELTNE